MDFIFGIRGLFYTQYMCLSLCITHLSPVHYSIFNRCIQAQQLWKNGVHIWNLGVILHLVHVFIFVYHTSFSSTPQYLEQAHPGATVMEKQISYLESGGHFTPSTCVYLCLSHTFPVQ